MKDKRFKKLISAVLVLSLLFSLAGCKGREPSVIGTVPENKTISLSIAVCGDAMAHMPQLNSADRGSGVYDFNENYDYVRGIMSSADLCLANVECTFPGGPEYAGYPGFKTPDSMAEALANAGVDVGIFANNHMNDSGLKGALRTVEVIEAAGMKCVGCRKDADKNRSIIVPVVKNGEVVNVGIVAFTYETSQGDSNRTMNGGAMNSKALDHYNTFRAYADLSILDRDLDVIKKEIAWCKDRADITIVYLHWGEEYQRHSNSRQQYIAEKLAEEKPDAIVASHPHVLQEISYVNDVPVYYSIGNYISNQRQETLDNHYTEQGLIAMLDFNLMCRPCDDGYYIVDGEFAPGANVLGTSEELKAEEEYNKKILKIFTKAPQKAPLNWQSFDNWKVEGRSVKAVPTWVNKYTEGGRIKYAIIPLTDGFKDNDSLIKAGYVNRAASALEEIIELIGEEFIWNLK